MINKDFFSLKVEQNPSTLADEDRPPQLTTLGIKTNVEMSTTDRYIDMLEQIAIAAWYYVRAPNNRSRINELLLGLARWDSAYGWDGKWQNDQPRGRRRKPKKAPKGKRRLTKKPNCDKVDVRSRRSS